MTRTYQIMIISFIACFVTLNAQTNNDETLNKRFYKDIGISQSILFVGDGSITNLHGAYYFTPKLGVRSGISYSNNIIDNCKSYIKIPILFSLRSETIRNDDPDFTIGDEDNLSDIILNAIGNILFMIPTRYEINIGPTIGYISSDSKLTAEEKRQVDDYFVNVNPMITLDANAKMTLALYRIGIDFSFGVSYLVTPNLKYYSNNIYSDKDGKTLRWIGNFSIGAHYRF